MGSARQRRRSPEDLPAGICDDLHVHPMPLAFRGVVGPAAAQPVALCERAVQENKVRIVCAWLKVAASSDKIRPRPKVIVDLQKGSVIRSPCLACDRDMKPCRASMRLPRGGKHPLPHGRSRLAQSEWEIL